MAVSSTLETLFTSPVLSEEYRNQYAKEAGAVMKDLKDTLTAAVPNLGGSIPLRDGEGDEWMLDFGPPHEDYGYKWVVYTPTTSNTERRKPKVQLFLDPRGSMSTGHHDINVTGMPALDFARSLTAKLLAPIKD
ncbi:MAG: hypothetical protein HYT09_02300, partial [Candidatus Levybacteria bacterium]|nr:hypothetical protein [Candidatus Levybacteria bacterium]